MKYIDADLLRKEIERRIRSIESCPFIEAEVGAYDKRDGKLMAFRNLLDFLDTLPVQPVTDHHEIEVEFRREKVTISREFYRKEDKNYSTNEQDDNVIWAALRAWCEKKGITAFELYPQQPEQPVEGLEDEIATWIPNHIKCEKDPDLRKVIIKWAGFVARHFAEWGAEHLK